MNRAITKQELDEMLTRYRIGKKPLSKLLGWGETTVLLYTEADELPDNEFTRRLYELYSNVQEYMRVLKTGEGRISSVAYAKSLSAVYELFPSDKLMDCAAFILDMTGVAPEDEISLTRIEAILFWSQVVSLVLYDTRMFNDDYQPGRTGHPYKRVEERLKKYGCVYPETIFRSALNDRKIKEGMTALIPEEEVLTVQDVDILQFVTGMFSWYGKNALEKLAEAERTRLCGPAGSRKRRMASCEMLKRCYTEVFSQAKVRRLKDVAEYMSKRITFLRKTAE